MAPQSGPELSEKMQPRVDIPSPLKEAHGATMRAPGPPPSQSLPGRGWVSGALVKDARLVAEADAPADEEVPVGVVVK